LNRIICRQRPRVSATRYPSGVVTQKSWRSGQGSGTVEAGPISTGGTGVHDTAVESVTERFGFPFRLRLSCGARLLPLPVQMVILWRAWRFRWEAGGTAARISLLVGGSRGRAHCLLRNGVHAACRSLVRCCSARGLEPIVRPENPLTCPLPRNGGDGTQKGSSCRRGFSCWCRSSWGRDCPPRRCFARVSGVK